MQVRVEGNDMFSKSALSSPLRRCVALGTPFQPPCTFALYLSLSQAMYTICAPSLSSIRPCLLFNPSKIFTNPKCRPHILSQTVKQPAVPLRPFLYRHTTATQYAAQYTMSQAINSNEDYCSFTLPSDLSQGGLPSEADICKVRG